MTLDRKQLEADLELLKAHIDQPGVVDAIVMLEDEIDALEDKNE